LKLVIGSRGSQLALWQSEWAKARLLEAHPDLSVDIEVIKTKGDTNLAASFSEIGSKGVFTKEVDEALLSGQTHFSVHSLKDLPTTFPDGLSLTTVSPRADVRDAVCAREVTSLDALPQGARVATSSLRRQALLRSERPDLELVPLRGNVDTRLKKLVTEELDAIILAGAGLKRLSFDDHISELLDPSRFIPAAGQGVMAIVSREDDRETAELLSVMEDGAARYAITAERQALADLGGGCRIPFGAWARIEDETLVMDGVVAHPERGEPVRAHVSGDPERAAAMGKQLAADLLSLGGKAILEEVLA
jgi:hydroxymethylbilane synthase